jgi:hypothetical protein
MPHGHGFAWELTEARADDAIGQGLSTHRKVHGQSYWKLSDPRGALSAFLRVNNIRA